MVSKSSRPPSSARRSEKSSSSYSVFPVDALGPQLSLEMPSNLFDPAVSKGKDCQMSSPPAFEDRGDRGRLSLTLCRGESCNSSSRSEQCLLFENLLSKHQVSVREAACSFDVLHYLHPIVVTIEALSSHCDRCQLVPTRYRVPIVIIFALRSFHEHDRCSFQRVVDTQTAGSRSEVGGVARELCCKF